MACGKCKKKRERELVIQEIERMDKPVKIIMWSVIALGLYGLYSLISVFI